MTHRHRILAALSGLAAFAIAPAAAAAGPLFPVVVAAPAAVETPIGSGRLFTQAVRPASAVRTTSDNQISYVARLVDRKMFGGGGLTLPANTLFVQATFDGQTAYCAAVAPKKENLLTFFDVGLCLRDRDADGVFDEQMVFEPTQRMRTAYEITPGAALGGPPSWAPAKVAYAAVAAADVPSGELRISYEASRINVRGRGALRLELCWPDVLVVPGAVKAGQALCGILAPAGAMVARQGDEVRFHARGTSDQTLAWGRVAVRLTDTTARYEAPWPAGASVVGLLGAFRIPNEYKYQQSIFGIGPAPAP